MNTKLEFCNGNLLWSKDPMHTPVLIEKTSDTIMFTQQGDIIEIEISNIKELFKIINGLIKEDE
jgi:hypothetical protein